VIPTVLGIAPPSVPVDALVNVSDGTGDMVTIGNRVNITLRR
jgi:hypothetical protein